jgi:lipid II:glycine glycyltransferase (peptidoglycan interpeptide bridge formation enzyme)
MEKDFSWIIRILYSSTKNEHLIVSDKLFENFKKKWSESIEDSTNNIVYTRRFNKEKNNIQKKLGYS